MAYVDGFVVPVPKKNLQAYRRLARKAGKIWREHGALEFRECVAESELLFTLVRISSTNQLSLALICMQISHGHSFGDAH